MKKLFFFASLVLISLNAFSQIIFDLGDKNTTNESIGLSSISSVVFKSLTLKGVKNNQYHFSVDMEELKIPPFTTEFTSVLKTAGASCEELGDEIGYAIDSFMNEKDESEISLHIRNLKRLERGLKPEQKNCKDFIDQLIEETAYTKPLQFEFRNNQVINITATRSFQNNGKDTVVTWVRVFKTPKKSPWKVLYGFTFVPNVLSKVDNFYTKATDATNQSYTITKLNNNSKTYWENISPTIMFQWAPSSLKENGGSSIQLGFVGGISLNFAKETGSVNVLAGPSIIIADNLSISGGLTFIQKNVLMGQYKEGDIVKEKLDFGQLHEKKYMLEGFISIAFRFDQNPFSGKKDSKKE